MNAQMDRDAGPWSESPHGAAEHVSREADGLSEVLDSLVTSIEEAIGGGMIGSVLVLDAAGSRLRNAAAPHLPVGYCNAIDGLRAGPKAGSCGTVVPGNRDRTHPGGSRLRRGPDSRRHRRPGA